VYLKLPPLYPQSMHSQSTLGRYPDNANHLSGPRTKYFCESSNEVATFDTKGEKIQISFIWYVVQLGH